MAEIKNSFSQGKMNKDLDERLLPVGQYRDAMNIQVSTSEGSDVGTVQNILGNENFSNIFNNDVFYDEILVQGASYAGECVGVISDEKNNHVYWFLVFNLIPPPLVPGQIGRSEFLESASTSFSCILRNTPKFNKSFTPVFIDHKNVLGLIKDVNQNTNYAISNDDTIPFQIIIDGTTFPFNKLITGINIIDNMLFFTNNISEPKKININDSILGSVGSIFNFQNHTKLYLNNSITSDDVTTENVTVIKKSPKNPLVLEMSDGVREGRISGTFNKDANGNNIDLIGVKRGDVLNITLENEAGTVGSGAFNLNRNDVVVIDSFDIIPPLAPLSDFLIKGVIRTIDETGGTAADGWRIGVEILSIDSETPTGLTVDGLPFNFILSLFQEEEKLFKFKFPRFSYRYKYKDGEYSCFAPFSEIAFLPSNFDYHPRKAYNLGMVNNLTQLHLKEFVTKDMPLDVVSIDLLYKESDSNNIYVLESLSANSAEFNFQNTTEVDIDGNIVTLDIIKKGKYEVKSETIYAILPSNQLLRPFDNVPIRALAQELTGNRIVYANYIQNYNLSPNTFNNEYKPNLSLNLKAFAENIEVGRPHKSIKSLRDYQLGVVYVDEFGRQTPVITSSSATVKVSKKEADNSTQLVAKAENNNIGQPPAWAKGFKFYVKETSGEYYNLAMDRFYDAEDGNIWLAFPSIDRNKVDLETTLILKKGPDSDFLVEDQARYKVIDVSNEAPDFVKEKKLPIGEVIHDYDINPTNNSVQTAITNPVFTNDVDDFPRNEQKTFVINSDSLIGTSSESIKELSSQGKKIFCRFELTNSSGAVTTSKEYRISNIGAEVVGASQNLESGTEVKIILDENFSTDIDFIFATASAPNTFTTPTYVQGTTRVGHNVKLIFTLFSVENSPKFDGRFFVKVHNSPDTQVQLGSGKNEKYRVVATRTFYYLSNNIVRLYSGSNYSGIGAIGTPTGSNPLLTAGTNNAHVNGINYLNAQPLTSYGDDSARVWGGTGAGGFAHYLTRTDDAAFWYKFTAFFRKKATHSIQARAAHNSSSTTSMDNFEDIWYIDGHTNAGTFGGQNTQVTNGVNLNKIDIGIGGLEPNISASSTGTILDYHQFDLSFNPPAGYIFPTPQGGAGSQNPQQYRYEQNESPTGWNQSGIVVGNESVNPKYGDEEIIFSQKLAPGTKIRWQNDPDQTVYTIQSVTNKYVLRYADDPSNVIERDHYYRPENFNRNWVLTLDKNVTWNPVTDGNMNGYSINTDAYTDNFGALGLSDAVGQTLEIVEEIVDDAVLSENPAIWETEPKEQAELDIYHQASKVYPIRLNEKNIFNTIKIGSKVRVFNTSTGQYENLNAQVNGLDFTEEFDDDYTPRYIGFNPNAGVNYSVGSGAVVQVTDEWNENNIDPNIHILEFVDKETSISFSVKNISQTLPSVADILISVNVHSSPIELDFFNCYSFGNGVESNRIEDNFNKPFIDKGPIASTTLALDQEYKQEKREHGLIYSGLYNSVSGVNSLNQFIQAEKITKEINPIYGSIQKLHSRSTAGGDLITICEDKVLKILANKDALFNADGDANLTSTNNVLGQTIPLAGDYGISKNPESFAHENYRSYFTDKQRGAVLRLSMDGLTPISEYGMSDWFKDNLKDAINIIGSYDQKKKEYNVTIINGKKVESKTAVSQELADSYLEITRRLEEELDAQGNPLPGSENLVFTLLQAIQTTFVMFEFFDSTISQPYSSVLLEFFESELVDRGLNPTDYGIVQSTR
tara:strand:- start:4631 stop:9880 length:5250 start_codon:yes stop_codon:yes gene_type:complete